jgi:hypothetical protein
LAETAALHFGRIHYYVTHGMFASGEAAEIFISGNKPTSETAQIVSDAGVILSIALQSGASLDVLRHAVARNRDGSPVTIIGAALDVVSARIAVNDIEYQSSGSAQNDDLPF